MNTVWEKDVDETMTELEDEYLSMLGEFKQAEEGLTKKYVDNPDALKEHDYEHVLKLKVQVENVVEDASKIFNHLSQSLNRKLDASQQIFKFSISDFELAFVNKKTEAYKRQIKIMSDSLHSVVTNIESLLQVVDDRFRGKVNAELRGVFSNDIEKMGDSIKSIVNEKFQYMGSLFEDIVAEVDSIAKEMAFIESNVENLRAGALMYDEFSKFKIENNDTLMRLSKAVPKIKNF